MDEEYFPTPRLALPEEFHDVSALMLEDQTGHAIYAMRFNDDDENGPSITTMETNGNTYTWRSYLAITKLKQAYEQYRESNAAKYADDTIF